MKKVLIIVIAGFLMNTAQAEDGEEIEIWGDGKQTRSFLHVSECVEGIRRLMESEFSGPVNIGSDYLNSEVQSGQWPSLSDSHRPPAQPPAS